MKKSFTALCAAMLAAAQCGAVDLYCSGRLFDAEGNLLTDSQVELQPVLKGTKGGVSTSAELGAFEAHTDSQGYFGAAFSYDGEIDPEMLKDELAMETSVSYGDENSGQLPEMRITPAPYAMYSARAGEISSGSLTIGGEASIGELEAQQVNVSGKLCVLESLTVNGGVTGAGTMYANEIKASHGTSRIGLLKPANGAATGTSWDNFGFDFSVTCGAECGWYPKKETKHNSKSAKAESDGFATVLVRSQFSGKDSYCQAGVTCSSLGAILTKRNIPNMDGRSIIMTFPVKRDDVVEVSLTSHADGDAFVGHKAYSYGGIKLYYFK